MIARKWGMALCAILLITMACAGGNPNTPTNPPVVVQPGEATGFSVSSIKFDGVESEPVVLYTINSLIVKGKATKRPAGTFIVRVQMLLDWVNDTIVVPPGVVRGSGISTTVWDDVGVNFTYTNTNFGPCMNVCATKSAGLRIQLIQVVKPGDEAEIDHLSYPKVATEFRPKTVVPPATQ